jgi:hypothetical protein
MLFLVMFAVAKVALAQDSGFIELLNNATLPATISLSDGRSCTADAAAADGSDVDPTGPQCSIENVRAGTYAVTVTFGGRAVSQQAVVGNGIVGGTYATCALFRNGNLKCR